MKTLLLLISVIWIMLLPGKTEAQVANTNNYAFTYVSNGSLTDMSIGASNLLLPKTNGGNFKSAVFPIGFDFWLMGVRYNYFSVNSNGLMRLGRKALTNTSSNDMTNGSNLPLLTAFWDDLNSYTTSSTSKVRYKVTGVSPNRVLTVEWKDFIIKRNSTSGSQLSKWQIRLNETTGIIENVYGRMQVASSSSTVTASIGFTNTNAANGMIALTSLSAPAVSTTAVGNYNQLINSNAAGDIVGLNSVANGNRVIYKFTSWLPTAAPSNLTFSAVGSSGMTLNWNDNASNELGYVIYRSDDGGGSYRFAKQTAANATTSVLSALLPNVTYYWKVYAVTEGALSTSANGSQTTLSCVGGPAINNFQYNSTVNGAYIWSANNNWSLAHPPTSCENAVITYTGGSNRTINMDIDAAVNSLSINGNFSSGAIKRKVVVNTFGNLLTILTNLNLSSNQTGSIASGVNFNEVNLLGQSGSVIRINGNCLVGQTGNSQVSYIGADTTTELNPVPVPSQDPEYYFKGNLSFVRNATRRSPGNYYFDGGPTQTITNNSPSGNPVRFTDVQIGEAFPTTLTITSTLVGSHYTYVDMGSVNVVSGSTLALDYRGSMNQYSPIILDDESDQERTVFNLSANATLRLGDNTNGQPGSNFPLNFDVVNIDSASTVEYKYSNAGNQVIYVDTTFDYGNLILTGSTKSLAGDINILGDLTVNSTANWYVSNFAETIGYLASFKGANFINNGAVRGTHANSRFSFLGSTAQTYSGTGSFANAGVPFGGWGIDIANLDKVTLNSPLYTTRLNLYYGNVINASQFTVGNGTTAKLYRGGVAGYDAGSLDDYPVMNAGTSYAIHYDEANAIITGYEIPASGLIDSLYSNNPNGVTMSSDIEVSTDLQLIQNGLDIVANKLSIGNTITKGDGYMIGLDATLEMNGDVAQNIPAGSFLNNRLKNLIVNNSESDNGVSLNGPLDIYRSVNFGLAGLKLTTGGFLTFKSTATETAWLGDMTGKTISGDATVERYIPLHAKAWQFLSVPTMGQTVKASWQEGSVSPNSDPNPGYGINITSPVTNATTHPTPGFDVQTSTPSVKTYDPASGNWIGIPSTAIQIANQKGYMAFVRGDRSVTTSAASPTPTVLRTKGNLFTPGNPPPATSLAAGTFESVGNPYPSAINPSLLTRTGGVQDLFYVWDPKLTTFPSTYGLGAYQTLSWNGSEYDVTPGGGSYPSGTCSSIESGQAFFVSAPLSAGTISFSESAKVQGSGDVNKFEKGNYKQLRTNLHVISGANDILIDGTMIQYHPKFSNAVDIEDAYKLGNTGENLGIMSNTVLMAVERRKLLVDSDTIFYRLGQLRLQQYEFEFIPTELYQPNLKAFLEDNYLHTISPVAMNETSRFRFTVSNTPGSYATDRFRLVFKKTKGASQVPAIFATTDKSGKISWEKEDASIPEVNLYPNPVTGKTLALEFKAVPAGKYDVALIQNDGRKYQLAVIQLQEGQKILTVNIPPQISAGVYNLQVNGENQLKIVKVITIL